MIKIVKEPLINKKKEGLKFGHASQKKLLPLMMKL